jgi:hypothetical protein
MADGTRGSHATKSIIPPQQTNGVAAKPQRKKPCVDAVQRKNAPFVRREKRDVSARLSWQRGDDGMRSVRSDAERRRWASQQCGRRASRVPAEDVHTGSRS